MKVYYKRNFPFLFRKNVSFITLSFYTYIIRSSAFGGKKRSSMVLFLEMTWMRWPFIGSYGPRSQNNFLCRHWRNVKDIPTWKLSGSTSRLFLKKSMMYLKKGGENRIQEYNAKLGIRLYVDFGKKSCRILFHSFQERRGDGFCLDVNVGRFH